MADIRGSALTAILIPSLQNNSQIKSNQPTHAIHLVRREALISCELNRLRPEFADRLLSLNVNVFRLIAIETVKEKTIRPGYIPDRRHHY
jgi:hypothetical protein